jgi:hypothetical protein
MAKIEADGSVADHLSRRRGPGRFTCPCARERHDGGARREAVARNRRPPRPAGRQAARAGRAARASRRAARARRGRRPWPVGRGDRGSAVERAPRVGAVRTRRRRSSDPVDASRLARATIDRCPSRRPDRSGDSRRNRGPGLADADRSLRRRREAHGAVRPGLRSPHPRSDGSATALAGRLEPEHHVLRRHPRRLGTGRSRLGRVPARDRGRRPLPHADRPTRNTRADRAMIGVR